MQPKTAILGVLGALTLAACDMPAADPLDECGASRFQALVGQPPVNDQWPETLAVRVIDPDTMVTLDFVPTRMNVWVDRNGLIGRINCG